MPPIAPPFSPWVVELYDADCVAVVPDKLVSKAVELDDADELVAAAVLFRKKVFCPVVQLQFPASKSWSQQ